MNIFVDNKLLRRKPIWLHELFVGNKLFCGDNPVGNMNFLLAELFFEGSPYGYMNISMPSNFNTKKVQLDT